MMVDERLRVVDAFMPELGDIERGMARKAIRVDDAVRFDFVSDDRNQRVSPGVRRVFGMTAACASATRLFQTAAAPHE